MKTKIPKPVCPKCESTQNYFRQQEKSHVCRICGNVWLKEKKEKVSK